MLVTVFFSWWYGRGWRGLAANLGRRMRQTEQLFSAGILLNTLFAPWRRIVTVPGSGIDAQLRAMADNMVSRFVGFTVRVLVLFTAGIVLTAVGALALIELVGWPLLPLIAVALFLKGITG